MVSCSSLTSVVTVDTLAAQRAAAAPVHHGVALVEVQAHSDNARFAPRSAVADEPAEPLPPAHGNNGASVAARGKARESGGRQAGPAVPRRVTDDAGLVQAGARDARHEAPRWLDDTDGQGRSPSCCYARPSQTPARVMALREHDYARSPHVENH